MSDETPLLLHFEPRTIEHLGVRMYSTLPPALAELVSNAYDADAESVQIELGQKNNEPLFIKVTDDGFGMSADDIRNKFLVIGRNRRVDDGDEPSPKFKRRATGKKGLGKLALFGLAKTISITTRKAGFENTFKLSWNDLMSSSGQYNPAWLVKNQPTTGRTGTEVILEDLKRKSPFDLDAISKSLALIFYFDDNFNLTVKDSQGNVAIVNNAQKYTAITEEFSWDEKLWLPDGCEYPNLKGKIISAETPISPRSGLRGITLFSRGKLVNAPEFFSESTSSHFYQYVTGYIIADFIDELHEDVISTNRQAVDWEHPDMVKFRKFLSATVSQVNASWRAKRKEKKDEEVKEATGGIDREDWLSKLPEDTKNSVAAILSSLGGDEAIGKIAPIIKELHNIAPEYPQLHWRHLHVSIKDRIRVYYEQSQYGLAAREGVLIYLEVLRNLTGLKEDGRPLVDGLFTYNKNKTPPGLPKIQLNSLQTESEENIQDGHSHFSRGVVTGFRNPIQHRPIDSAVPGLFSELDCLNILSLISYLLGKLDNAVVNS
ncbi:MAG: TIGR02391 family protein [Deltaproteobacteria bacterium]|nr:TIGR02391 family protein [Deltaproteobacteria bacterium]MBI9019821.1 TIGR02391 family protein [Verrucomicrobiota bacterium]